MKNFHCNVEIAAPAAAVFQAVTTDKGLKSWWTPDCDVGSGVGSRSTFRFGKTYNIMLVEKVVPDKEVVWRCLEQNHEAAGLKQKGEWAGTRIKFRLESLSPTLTRLHFEHDGLTPQLECYQICENRWGHYMRTSLKGYVETGRGEPFSSEEG